MALYDYEVKLQTEIVNWRCSRYVDCIMEFIPKPRHIKLGMRGLAWSIEAKPGLGLADYTFNIIQVKRSENPLDLSEASTAPDLPPKFRVLLMGVEMSIKSVFRAEEALDRLYSFSLLFFRAGEDKRWWIIADAEITATACKTTKEATQQAAQAAACFLLDHSEPLPLEKRQTSISSCGRSGWWIDQWTVADELWATGFFQQQSLNVIRQFQAKAVEGGNVLQWCSIQVSDTLSPRFEFEVAVEDILEGDDVLLRIGVANDRALKVRVFLTENLKVECFQKGVETESSLGLCYLLPDFVRDYIKTSLELNVAAESRNINVVQGLLQRVVGYLAFLGKVCVVCGSDRLLEVPETSSCSNICKARKQGYEAALLAGNCVSSLCISEDPGSDSDSARKREQYVRKLYSNSNAGCAGLEFLLKEAVVEKEVGAHNSEEDALGRSRRRPSRLRKEMEIKNIIGYEDAVKRVARMDSRSISTALGIEISNLWRKDGETVSCYSDF